MSEPTIVPHRLTNDERAAFYCTQATDLELADLFARADFARIETITGVDNVREGRYLSADERKRIVAALRRKT